jgi:hypothetical protein
MMALPAVVGGGSAEFTFRNLCFLAGVGAYAEGTDGSRTTRVNWGVVARDDRKGPAGRRRP